MLGNIEGGEGANGGWDGWMASLTQQTWVWASFGRWWRTGKPGMLQSMGSQKSWTHLSNWTTTIEHSRISFRGNIEVSAPVLFLRLFWYGPFFKVFIEFVTILLLFYVLVFWPQDLKDLSSLTRDWTHTSCIGRWSLNHWDTRDVPLPRPWYVGRKEDQCASKY